MDFIQNYLKYTQGYETPQIYDLWSALSTLASVSNRKVWVDQGYFRVYPHMYITLVGPAGGGKTSSMEISQLMLEDVGDIMFAGTAMTKEALAKKLMGEGIRTFALPDGSLKEYTPMTLCLTELSHFLGVNSAHMIDFLVTVFDKENYKSETKNMGNDVIPAPGLNILACTTPSNITRYLKEDVISGGFSSRNLFVLPTDPGHPVPRPKVSDEAAAARLACLDYLRSLRNVTGEFRLTDEANAWYDKWYREYWTWLETQPETIIKGYQRRKLRVHIWKVSMMYALSDSFALVIDVPHLELALASLNRIEKSLERVYEGIGRNELSPILAKAMENIHAAGGALVEKELHALLNRDANYGERMEIIRTMVETGRAIRFEDVVSKKVLLATPDWIAAHSSLPAPSPTVADAPVPSPQLPSTTPGSTP